MTVLSPLRRRIGLALSALACCLALPVHAAGWPSGPLHMIVPFPPGSSPDILARIVAEPLGKALEQVVVVENRPGAGGNIGTRAAARAQPDGNTLLMTINGPMVTAPFLYKKTLGYDPRTDLSPVTLIGTSPNVLVVPASSEIHSVQDFVALARSRPGELNYGTVGPGSSSHLAMAMLEDAAGIKLEQIPYTGFPQVITAIINGDVQAGFMVPGIAMPQIEAGKVRALAITSLEPSDLLPGIPTMESQGYPGFRSISWNAMFVPAQTPQDIVARLNQDVMSLLERPDVRERMRALYFTPAPSTPAELTQLMNDERKQLGGIIERLGLSLD